MHTHTHTRVCARAHTHTSSLARTHRKEKRATRRGFGDKELTQRKGLETAQQASFTSVIGLFY